MENNIIEGYLPFKEFKTYYRIANKEGKKTPLLFLHGGPGSTHNSFEVFDHAAFLDDRPFIYYDQIGCGLSYVEGHEELFNKETWVEELINLREKLKLDEVNILGHSWGGMLAIIYLCDYAPKGVKSCILSSTLASASLWEEETHRLIKYLPKYEQEAIKKAEESNDFSSLEANLAIKDYTTHFVSGPFNKNDAECITRKKVFNKLAYNLSWGKGEFAPSGNLKGYEYLDKVSNIKCPILILNGVNDESTPYQNKCLYDKLTCEKSWEMFSNSRHMSYYEEHDKYVKILLDFLNR